MPFNILIRERHVTVNGRSAVRPQAKIVDWAQAKAAPYIIDITRLTSHCSRLTDPDLFGKPYCDEAISESVHKQYYLNIREVLHRSEDEYRVDIMCGKFFEVASMYIQMPTSKPQDAYDMLCIINKINLGKDTNPCKIIIHEEKQ